METVKIALTQYGVNEREESETHPQIIQYYHSIGYTIFDFLEYPKWSSAFLNWVAKNAGLEHSGKLEANSWLSTGEITSDPNYGDVVGLESVKESNDG